MARPPERAAKPIDKRDVSLAYGQSARIVLRGKGEDTGVLPVAIDWQ